MMEEKTTSDERGGGGGLVALPSAMETGDEILVSRPAAKECERRLCAGSALGQEGSANACDAKVMTSWRTKMQNPSPSTEAVAGSRRLRSDVMG